MSAEQLVAALRRRSRTLVTAESLTGGLVIAGLVEVPGASEVIRGAVVAYVADLKREVLGVPAAVIDQYGVVSAQCAEAMAVGARTVLASDWALATTGAAGPEPHDGAAPGTVHIAVAGEHHVASRALHLSGSRQDIRLATVKAVIDLALDLIDREDPDGDPAV